MNKCQFVGRIIKQDAELRFLESGTARAHFTIAVKRAFAKEGQPDADFIPCVMWGKRAEKLTQYLTKNKVIWVSGAYTTRNYEKDGRKVYITEINVEDIGFPSRDTSEQSQSSSGFDRYGTDVDIDDEDSIPF